jgi:hypothetical protein
MPPAAGPPGAGSAATHYGQTSVVAVYISVFFIFFPRNHFINIKKKSFSGKVKDIRNVPFYFLLHKLHQPPTEVMIFIFYSDEITIDVKTGLVT